MSSTSTSRAGKSDPIDAVRAAKELLARDHHTTPRADGDREALRVLMVDRNHAVEARKTTRSTLMSLIVTAPADLREHLRGLSQRQRPRVCAELKAPATADRATRVLYQSLARLGHRILSLGTEIEQLTTEIAQIVTDLAPGLVESEPGLGSLGAAQVLLSYSHAGRIRTEAAFAMLAGVAPIPASSGRTTRHRLNRLGDRQLNRALHIVVVNRMRYHQPTRDYVTRRRLENKSDHEIRRCLKRYLARHLYRRLNHLDTA